MTKVLGKTEIRQRVLDNDGLKDTIEAAVEYGLYESEAEKIAETGLTQILDYMFVDDNSDVYEVADQCADDIMDAADVDVSNIIAEYPERIDISEFMDSSKEMTFHQIVDIAEYVVKTDLTRFTAQAIRSAIEEMYDTDPCSSAFDAVFPKND